MRKKKKKCTEKKIKQNRNLLLINFRKRRKQKIKERKIRKTKKTKKIKEKIRKGRKGRELQMRWVLLVHETFERVLQ